MTSSKQSCWERLSHLEHSCDSTIRHLEKSHSVMQGREEYSGDLAQAPAAHCHKNYFGYVHY